MGVGQIIADTFGIVKSRFGSLLAVWAIYFAITIACWMILGLGMGATMMTTLLPTGQIDPPVFGAGTIIFMILFYIGYLVVVMAQYASLIVAASPVRRSTALDAVSAGWRAAPALVLLMLVIGVAYLVCVLILVFAGFALRGLAGEGTSAVLVILLVPVLVWLGIRLAPLLAVIAVDGVRNPFDAISQAWNLTRGHALAIFLASLVLLLIVVGAALVIMLPSIGMIRAMSDPASVADTSPALGVGFVLSMVGFFLVAAVFSLCQAAFQAVIHARLSRLQGEPAAPLTEI